MRVDRRVLGSLAVLAALTAGCDNTNGSAKNTGKQDTGKADAAKSEKTTAATKAPSTSPRACR